MNMNASLTATVVSTVVLFVSLLPARAEERPNLLFILSDDQRDDSFAGMGHDCVQTPNIDSLLSRGIRFENAYIAEPTCNPSRGALYLGASRLGNVENASKRASRAILHRTGERARRRPSPYLK